MARVKNSAFVGATPSDVDVDAPTWMRVIKNAIGDLALVYDMVTGLNAEANTMTHGGAGRGARLGFPWVNQTFGGRGDRLGQWGIDLAYTMAPDASSGKVDGGVGTDTIIFGVPVFIPPGETDMTIVVTGHGLDVWPWRVKLLKESDGSTLLEAGLVRSIDESGAFERLSLSTNDNGTDGTGMLCLMLVFADTSSQQLVSGTMEGGQVRAFSLFAGPTRIRGDHGTSVFTSTIDAPAITTGSPFHWRDFDATLFAERLPIHSYLTGGASRNLNALIEYIRGWPVGGNPTYALIDSGATNPVTSRFLAHTLSTLATEPAIAMPLMAQAFGAAQEDGKMAVDSVIPTAGLLDWYGYMPIATASSRFAEWLMRVPDFDTASSKLKSCTLAVSDVMAQGVNWSSSWNAGSATAFAQVSTSKLMTSKHTALAFTADDENNMILKFEKSAAKTTDDEVMVLGSCLYFEP